MSALLIEDKQSFIAASYFREKDVKSALFGAFDASRAYIYRSSERFFFTLTHFMAFRAANAQRRISGTFDATRRALTITAARGGDGARLMMPSRRSASSDYSV